LEGRSSRARLGKNGGLDNQVLDEELKTVPWPPRVGREFQMEQQQDAELEAIQEEAELEADSGVVNERKLARRSPRSRAGSSAHSGARLRPAA